MHMSYINITIYRIYYCCLGDMNDVELHTFQTLGSGHDLPYILPQSQISCIELLHLEKNEEKPSGSTTRTRTLLHGKINLTIDR